MKKTKLYFTEAEWQYIIHSLNALRSKLISEGRYTDTVDETLCKFINARTKRVKVEG
jgi:hypothetical protein